MQSTELSTCHTANAGAAAVAALLGGIISIWGDLLLASLSVSALLLSWVILVLGRDRAE
jgi:DHA1 family tetracycline resistance protein-like MFS transporter